MYTVWDDCIGEGNAVVECLQVSRSRLRSPPRRCQEQTGLSVLCVVTSEQSPVPAPFWLERLNNCQTRLSGRISKRTCGGSGVILRVSRIHLGKQKGFWRRLREAFSNEMLCCRRYLKKQNQQPRFDSCFVNISVECTILVCIYIWMDHGPSLFDDHQKYNDLCFGLPCSTQHDVIRCLCTASRLTRG